MRWILAAVLVQETNGDLPGLLDSALRKEKAGDWSGAVADYTCALRLKPVSGLYFLRASARWKGGDQSGALADMAESIRLDPANADAYYVRGLWFETLGNTERAVEEVRTSVDVGGPEWPGYEGALGKLEGLGVKRDPVAAEKADDRGRELLAADDFSGALAMFSRAIRNDPRNPRYWYNRGMSRFALSDDLKARVDFRQAVKLDPDFASAWAMRGESAIRLKAWVEAVDSLEKALKLNPRLEGTFGRRLQHARDQARK
jgi:tetratricopeptide (TPR) repeat protein